MDEKDKEYARSIVQKSLSKQFAPEFLNRLDAVSYTHLDVYKRQREYGIFIVFDDDFTESGPQGPLSFYDWSILIMAKPGKPQQGLSLIHI